MIKALFLNTRLFYLLFILGGLYISAFFFSFLLSVANIFLAVLVVVFIVDYLFIFNKENAILASRLLPEKLSNGDVNPVKIEIQNNYPFSVEVKVIDEIPFQFQMRDFLMTKMIPKNKSVELHYTLEPKQRGEYVFGKLNVFVSGPIGFVSKRFVSQDEKMIPCYPSFVHLRTYELMALQNEYLHGGAKKIRRLGHTMEFEQIKSYVQGDDIRTINWKATSKQNQLMVNQYEDEKSQQVYLVIDKGRTMQMPFQGLSLLDYSINAAMALSHMILRKNDRPGMLTFSKTAENRVRADSKAGQLKKVSESLYKVSTDFFESDFSRLYQDVRYNINQRSLIILFTNFETLDAVKRQKKYLQSIARNHLLVVVFFKNAELQQLIKQKPENLQEIYDQIVAEKFEYEKKLIIQELRKNGIFSIYTLPENLSIEVINKYLEIKARGMH